MANQIQESHYMPPLPKLIRQDGDEDGDGEGREGLVPGSDPCTVKVTRPIYDQESFGAHYRLVKVKKATLIDTIKDTTTSAVRCNRRKFMTSLRKWLPFIGIMRHYKRKWLVGDIISGVSCGAVHIPQSLGFASLIGLPAVYGLYSSFFPLLIYFFFGTSHHLSIGTVAVVSLIVKSAVQKQIDTLKFNDSLTTTPSPGNGNRLYDGPCIFTRNETNSNESNVPKDLENEAIIMMVLTMTFVVGVMQFLMGICRLGIIASFMSTPFNTAFQTGAAVHTAVSQVAACLGFTIGAYPDVFTLIFQLKEILTSLHHTNAGDIIVALITLTVLVFVKEFVNIKYAHKLPVPIPADLLVVVVGIVISYLASLNKNYCVKVIGNIPPGFPAPKVPVLLAQVDKDYYYLPTFIIHLNSTFILDCVAVAVVSYAMCMTMAKIFARKYRYALDDDQELIAYGLMNCISSFFHCYPTAQSPPRTMIFETTGGMTQVSGVISAVVVMIVIVGLGPLFYNLPKAVLAMIVIVALFPIFKQFKELKVYWKINKFDFAVWVATFLAVLILDVPTGLAVGIGWNLLTMCAQSFVVRGYSLSSANHSDLFAASNAYAKVSEIAGIKIFRYEADIFFANVANFKRQLFTHTVNPQRLQLLREKLATAKAAGQKGQVDDQIQLRNSDDQDDYGNGVPRNRKSSSSSKELPAVNTKGGLVNSGFSNINEENEYTFNAESNNNVTATTSSANDDKTAPTGTANTPHQPIFTVLNDDEMSTGSLDKETLSLSDGKRVNTDLKHVTIMELNNNMTVKDEGEDTLGPLPHPSATSFSVAPAAAHTVSGLDGTNLKRKESAAHIFDSFYRPPDLDNISIDEDDGDLDEDVADIRSHVGSSSFAMGFPRRLSVQIYEVHTVVLDCGAVGYIDFNGLLTIRQLFEDYRDANITFLLAGCGKFMLGKLKTSGIFEEWKQHIFPSIIDAVLVSQIRHKQEKLVSADL